MRKPIPKKAIIPREKPTVVKIDLLKTKRQTLVAPKIQYHVMAVAEPEVVYNGEIIPIPKILLYYMRPAELMVYAVIAEETDNNGCCLLNCKEIATRLKASMETVYRALYTMRKAGFLKETSSGLNDRRKERIINYKAIQRLNDLVEGEDVGVYIRIRQATKKKDIFNMTKEDIQNSYDNKVLPPGHDPEEEEEYD